jgi:hypothetical protein
MKDNPIEVHVSIAIRAIVKGRSVAEIERDCKRLKLSIIGDMEIDEDTNNVTVDYVVTEIVKEEG